MIKRKYSQRIRFFLATYTPKIVAIPIYELHILLLRLATFALLPVRQYSLWIRHSYALGFWEPFASDIDISLWTALPPNDPRLIRWTKFYEKLRRYLPLLGEVNCYWNNGQLSGWINSFELKKDPRLQRLVYPSPSPDIAAEGLVFKLKYLESNAREVFAEPARFRPKKWQEYLKQVGEPQRPATPQGLLDNLGLTHQELESIKNYLNYLSSGQDHWLYEPDETVKTYYLNHFCLKDNCDYFKDQNHQPIIYSIIKWEIWGLGTQIPKAISQPEMKEAFQRYVKSLIQTVRTDSYLKLRPELSENLEVLNTFLN